MLFGEVKEYELVVKNPPKSAVVRFPTAQEWTERMAKQKSLRRNLGRGKFKTEIVRNPQADLELFAKIKLSGDDFDEAEAQHFVNVLADCDVLQSAPCAEGFKITLHWQIGKLEGETTHVLKIPTMREREDHRCGAVSVIENRHGMSEISVNIQRAVELYDKLASGTDGYSGDVPPTHKAAVVSELVQAMASDDEGDPKGF